METEGDKTIWWTKKLNREVLVEFKLLLSFLQQDRRKYEINTTLCKYISSPETINIESDNEEHDYERLFVVHQPSD